jgi:cardiolipin synthase
VDRDQIMRRLTWPNRITLMRILAVPVFVILVLWIPDETYGPVYRHLALGLFVALGLADLLDGFLARRLKQQTRLGTILDPLADKMLLTIACILLAFHEVIDPPLPVWLVVLSVSRDVFLSIGSLVLYLLIGRLHVAPTRLGRLTLVGLMLTVVMVLGADLAPARAAGAWRTAISVAAHLTGFLIVASGLQYGWIGRCQLDHAVTRPERKGSVNSAD